MHRFFWLSIICITLAFATRRDYITTFHNDIERIIHHADSTASVGIDIISLKTGESIYCKNKAQRFVPAELTQLFVLSAALEILGIDYTYKTDLLTDGSVEDGIVHGNLYIRGSGDPSLSQQQLATLAMGLHLNGINEVTGNLIVDTSAFDAKSIGPGWLNESGLSLSPPSALSINQSCCDIWIRPGLTATSAAEVVLDMPIQNLPFQFHNQALTLAADQFPRDITVTTETIDKTAIVHIAGDILLNSKPQHCRFLIKEPAMLSGWVLSHYLCSQHVAIRKAVVEGMAPQQGFTLSEHHSKPLALILQQIGKESNAYYSDNLFKTLGKEVHGRPGTWQSGSQAVREFLTSRVKLNTNDLVLLDGSGRSHYNLVTPAQVCQLLSWMHRQPQFVSEFKTTLSIAGVDGSLKDRLTGQQGLIRGLTGSMKGVTNLCGYLTTQDGEEMAIVIMVNRTVKSCQEIESRLIDPICVALHQFSREY